MSHPLMSLVHTQLWLCLADTRTPARMTSLRRNHRHSEAGLPSTPPPPGAPSRARKRAGMEPTRCGHATIVPTQTGLNSGRLRLFVDLKTADAHKPARDHDLVLSVGGDRCDCSVWKRGRSCGRNLCRGSPGLSWRGHDALPAWPPPHPTAAAAGVGRAPDPSACTWPSHTARRRPTTRHPRRRRGAGGCAGTLIWETARLDRHSRAVSLRATSHQTSPLIRLLAEALPACLSS